MAYPQLQRDLGNSIVDPKILVMPSCCIHSWSRLFQISSMSENGFWNKVKKWIKSKNLFLLDWFLFKKNSSSRYLEWSPVGVDRDAFRILTFESLVMWAFFWPPRFNKKGLWFGIQPNVKMRNLQKYALICQHNSLNQSPAFWSANIPVFWQNDFEITWWSDEQHAVMCQRIVLN